jgi:hypothetical protein
MVGKLMPVFRLFFYYFGEIFRVGANNEKSGAYAVLFKQSENARCFHGVRAVVEGEGDFFAAGGRAGKYNAVFARRRGGIRPNGAKYYRKSERKKEK